jgi:hypothetical protein
MIGQETGHVNQHGQALDKPIDRMKRIGIKYCGGCNPSYDRVSRIARLASALKDYLQLVSYDAPSLDLLLIVNGCPKGCADREDIRKRCKEVIVLQDEARGLEETLLAKWGLEPMVSHHGRVAPGEY